jgi:hypothetical protein
LRAAEPTAAEPGLRPALGKLSAEELGTWLRENAPESLKDQLLQVCKMAEKMQSSEGLDDGSAKEDADFD